MVNPTSHSSPQLCAAKRRPSAAVRSATSDVATAVAPCVTREIIQREHLENKGDTLHFPWTGAARR